MIGRRLNLPRSNWMVMRVDLNCLPTTKVAHSFVESKRPPTPEAIPRESADFVTAEYWKTKLQNFVPLPGRAGHLLNRWLHPALKNLPCLDRRSRSSPRCRPKRWTRPRELILRRFRC